MARLFHDGFEYNNTTANFPWTVNGGGAATYVTTTVRNGTYSGQISGLSSTTRAGWLMQFLAATGTGPYYARFYINITTLPSAVNTIAGLSALTTLGTARVLVRLNSNGTLILANAAATQIGSASAALSTGTWYMVELKFDNTGGAGAGILELRLNGSVVATSTTQTFAANVQSFQVGGNLSAEAQTTGKWFIEDVAVNDSTGASQTGYPGSGNIIRLKPNADGDNHGFTGQTGGTAGAANNYTRVNAVDLSQSATSNSDNVVNHVDDMNCENTGAAPGSNAVINVVTVDLAAFGNTGTPTNLATIRPRIKKTASGTISNGTAFIPPSGTLVLNKATAPWVPTLVLYNDPNGNPWTKTTLDSLQVGYIISTGNTNPAFATNASVQVDFYETIYTDSDTVGGTTTPSSVETAQFVESNTPATVGSITSDELAALIEASTPATVGSVTSSDIAAFVDSSTVAGVTSLSQVELYDAVDANTISGVSTPSADETAQYVESDTPSTVGQVDSTDISDLVEQDTPTSITYISSDDVADYVDSDTTSSTTSIDYVDGLGITDLDTITSTTTLDYTEIAEYVDGDIITSVSYIVSDEEFVQGVLLDSDTVTSTTTITGAETKIVVELVGYAMQHYSVEADNHYSVNTNTNRYTGKADNHYTAQAAAEYTGQEV